MYIELDLRRYRTLEEVGNIIMNVRIIAYYHLMQLCQGDPRYHSGKAPAPAFPEHHQFPVPLSNVEIQPSETCPKNYVIFDQTHSKSQVMFHPSLARKFGSSSFDMHNAQAHQSGTTLYRGDHEEMEDINALLSSDEGEGDEDDTIRTGRTPGSCSEKKRRERMKKMVKRLKDIVPGGETMDTPAVLDEAVKYLKSLKVEAKKLGVSNFD